jgi:hypothetical protein
MRVSEDQITNIAHYLYESDIENSSWFENTIKKKKNSALETELSTLEKEKN